MPAIPVARRLVHIPRAAYVEACAVHPHTFLVGDLKKPTTYPFIAESRLELVICSYNRGDDGVPHWHANVTEYEVVITGRVGYLDIAADATVWAGPGDLLSVPAGVCVKRLIPEQASTVAIKVPSSPEKTHCDACPRKCVHRLDPFKDDNQPAT